jgi:holliday junction DNA helicase RuvA
MIGRLHGTLVDRDATRVIVDCGGVGYEVTCSGYTLAGLPALGETVTLLIHTAVRETEIALYGFGSAQERTLFDMLITVKNVGPSSAVAILSGGHGPRDVAELIARDDVAGLTRIKGIGKKTAELLVVELRDKCELLMITWTADGELRPAAAAGAGALRPARAPRDPMLDDVAAALVGLGWRAAEVDKAVGQLAVEPGATLEALLRQALRAMPR